MTLDRPLHDIGFLITIENQVFASVRPRWSIVMRCLMFGTTFQAVFNDILFDTTFCLECGGYNEQYGPDHVPGHLCYMETCVCETWHAQIPYIGLDRCCEPGNWIGYCITIASYCASDAAAPDNFCGVFPCHVLIFYTRRVDFLLKGRLFISAFSRTQQPRCYSTCRK